MRGAFGLSPGALAAGGAAPDMLFHGGHNSTSTTDGSFNISSDIAVGRIVWIDAVGGTDRHLTAVSDASGDTWNLAASTYRPDATNTLATWWKKNTALMVAGATITATYNVGCNKVLQCASLGGLDQTSPLRTVGTGATGTGINPVATVTPTAANDVVTGTFIAVSGGADGASTRDPTFTLGGGTRNGTHRLDMSGYLPSSTALITKTDTLATSRVWLARLLVWKRA